MMQTTTAPAGYRIAQTTYRVPSASREGLTHTVTRLPGKLQCSCEAGSAGKGCWHVRSVVAGLVKPHIRLESQAAERASDLLWN